MLYAIKFERIKAELIPKKFHVIHQCIFIFSLLLNSVVLRFVSYWSLSNLQSLCYRWRLAAVGSPERRHYCGFVNIKNSSQLLRSGNFGLFGLVKLKLFGIWTPFFLKIPLNAFHLKISWTLNRRAENI